MAKHLLVLTLILLSTIVRAQTNVSGNITSNTTWTKANSPYILTGNVGVPSAYTLTIEPGATVQRSSDYQILINGAVQFNGTAADSISFVNENSFTADSRFFIEFKKSNLDNSSLSFLSFQSNYGKTNNIRIGDESENFQTNPKNAGILNITHSNLSNGYTVAKGYATTASINMDSCIAASAYIWQYYNSSEKITISNSKIYSSTVRSDDWNKGISLTNCYLNKANLMLAPFGSKLDLINSTVENSEIGDDIGFSPGGVVTITNSTFNNTIINGYSVSCIITNSTFNVTEKLYTVLGPAAEYMFTVGSLSISNCKLVNNSNYNVSGIYITGYGYSGPGNYNDTIIHNEFTNWYDAVALDKFDAIRLDSNNFSIAGRYDIVNHSPKDFSALYNYYQLKEGQAIDDIIYDLNDDLNDGLVTYTPNIPDPIVLPVTLLNFNGIANGHAINLNWQANKETNIAQYVVEKKVNNDFVAVGTVAATNVGSIINYSFTDRTPATGINYYRLKIMDANGRYTYSSVIPVTLITIVKGLSIYPNPAKTYVIVEHGVVSNDTQLMLVDMQGRKVKTLIIAKGATQTRIDIMGIAKGTYRIVWQSNTNTESQSLLIQ